MGRYEIQVLDSFDNLTYADGKAASIYGDMPPLVNAARKPGEWQTYDIVFEAPRFNGPTARLARLRHGDLERRVVHNRRLMIGPTSHADGARLHRARPGAAADAAGSRQSGPVPQRLGPAAEGIRPGGPLVRGSRAAGRGSLAARGPRRAEDHRTSGLTDQRTTGLLLPVPPFREPGRQNGRVLVVRDVVEQHEASANSILELDDVQAGG